MEKAGGSLVLAPYLHANGGIFESDQQLDTWQGRAFIDMERINGFKRFMHSKDAVVSLRISVSRPSSDCLRCYFKALACVDRASFLDAAQQSKPSW